ncbi:MAG: Fe-Mn family superoxide dismutase [Acidobacteriota bacterium]|nr:Fe-Mn family superoxide dismutase [Acidobacteriota bacterium]
MIQLPALSFPQDALKPYISDETLSYHYGKHHRAYVDNLNRMISGTKYEQMELTAIIRSSSGPIFNNAAQIWNHSFYWNSLTPNGGGQPTGKLAQLIATGFGSFEEFQKQFTSCALSTFGSGWAWLVKKPEGTLEIRSTGNAEPAFLNGDTPLLTCDVWEHAYYIDYRNDRGAYLKSFWNVVNYAFAEQNLAI